MSSVTGSPDSRKIRSTRLPRSHTLASQSSGASVSAVNPAAVSASSAVGTSRSSTAKSASCSERGPPRAYTAQPPHSANATWERFSSTAAFFTVSSRSASAGPAARSTASSEASGTVSEMLTVESGTRAGPVATRHGPRHGLSEQPFEASSPGEVSDSPNRRGGRSR